MMTETSISQPITSDSTTDTIMLIYTRKFHTNNLLPIGSSSTSVTTELKELLLLMLDSETEKSLNTLKITNISFQNTSDFTLETNTKLTTDGMET